MALELTHKASGSKATIVPERGAIVTRLLLRDKERLYLDETTLADPTKNVRGGIPLLFPSPGKLEGGRFARDGKSGEMKQHGFARDLPWTVVRADEALAILMLESNDVTRAMYPWDFSLTLIVAVADTSLTLGLEVLNTGREPMPIGFGIHPYFRVLDKAKATITTNATRAFNNVTKETGAFTGFDLTAPEVDLHLLDHGSGESILAQPGEHITVKTRPELGRWVVWTLAGKDFVCLEPWSAPGNALNTGEGLIELPAGEAKGFEIAIESE
jgi:galactose mutarotase-like enzyme